MKIGEFSGMPKMKKKRKINRSLAPDVTTSDMLLIDAANTHLTHESESNEESYNIYGAESRPGHEMHRIRKTQPHLWHKIKNWD